MKLFQQRYKHYVAWPVVLWCRLRGHKDTDTFWSGTTGRCIECGDVVSRQQPWTVDRDGTVRRPERRIVLQGKQ